MPMEIGWGHVDSKTTAAEFHIHGDIRSTPGGLGGI
jgi:hypothetical protein